MTEEEAFLLEFPSFRILNESKNHFGGNLNVKDDFYRVEFFAPNFPSTADISCKVLKGVSAVALQGLEPRMNLDIREYIQGLIKCLSSITEECHQTILQSAAIREFVDQLKLLSTETRCKVSLNRNYNLIKFTEFENYDYHYLELDISPRFDVSVRNHSLPVTTSSDTAELFSSAGTIEGHLAQFWRLLNQFEDFYANMNTIDELCTVVEPVNRTTKHNWRIFRITQKVYAKISVDPFSPSSIVMNFLGPTVEVEKYRAIYNENVKRWDVDLDVHRNLLRIFDLIYFPTTNEDGEEENYCNICYTYMLNDHIPIVSCDNSRCDLVFHAVCLKKWFATLKEGKTFLAVTFGNCPFCKEKLSASFVQLLDL